MVEHKTFVKVKRSRKKIDAYDVTKDVIFTKMWENGTKIPLRITKACHGKVIGTYSVRLCLINKADGN